MRPADAHDAAPDAPPSPPPSAGDPHDPLALAALEPLAVFGPFDLLGEAGRGGQGIVYRARRRGDGSLLAIKRLTAARRLSNRLRARFEREWEAARRLDHPCIVRPLDAEIVSGEMVIAMEWVEGVTITRWADGEPGSRPRRSPRECVVAIAAAVDAVVHAHQRGVIHRDLKPSNILVGPDGRPRILDFGLAKLLDDGEHSADAASLTGPDEVIGTIPYAAPEQILGGASHADTRADVYALGAVLYRILTGHPPHRADGPLAEVLRSLQHDPPRPSALAPAVDRELDAVVLRALRRAPGERYQSADAFAADLRRYLSGDPVHARPPRFIAHLRSLVRRHRAASASAAGLLAGVLIFGAVSGVLALRLAAERRTALQSAAKASAAAEESDIALDAVREMLASARPTESGGDTTVIELLGRAAEGAQSRLEAHPAAGAEVAYTIGYTYRSLWMWRESVPHLERALELSRLAYGPESEHVARSMVALGTSLSNLRDERAVSLQREALRLRRIVVPPDPSLVSESLMRLGYALHRAGQVPQWDEAERCLREALQLRSAVNGETHSYVAECLHHLGYLRWRQRRSAEAITLYQEASRVFRAAGAAATAEHAECLTGLASILAQTADHPAAIEIYQELIPLTRALYGRWQTYAPTLQLAASLDSTGDRAAAAAHFVEAVRIRADKLAIDSPDVAHPVGRLHSVLTADPDCAPAVAQALLGFPPGGMLELEPALRGLVRSWRGEGRTEAAGQLEQALPAEQGQP